SERLTEPETVNAINQLIDRVEELNRLLDNAGQMQRELPNLLAIGIDFMDALSRRASQEGIDLEQRATGLMNLFLKLTESKTLQAAEGLIDRLPQLEQASRFLDDVPGLVATLMDIVDEWTTHMKAEGFNLELSIRRGIRAALWLGERISESELERLGVLLQSEILNEHAIDAVAMAGTALAKCQEGSCELETPNRVGLLGLFRSLRDPNTQRTLAFAFRFSQCFGNALNTGHSTKESHPSLFLTERQAL
ncbi:MAG: DUF1641 domain-containing protein, partial [Planctomycetaceae bacterium]|nr:DUF1641 domain-containing protein [Planctomycetaceae bacterium]